jgi:glycosyltransferase involved in cell wall biosynthesis
VAIKKKVFVEMEKLKNLHSGLGQFCLNVGEEFKQEASQNLSLTVYLPKNKFGIFGPEINYHSCSLLHRYLPIPSTDFDVWHCAHQDSNYLPKNLKTKLILTIHDLNFLEKYSGLKRENKLIALQKKINRASAITVISKYTEQVIRQNLNLSNLPVHVIPNGNSLKIHDSAKAPDFINFSNYIFSIGILSPKKNFHTLLALLQHNKNLHLVIAGNTKSKYAGELIQKAEQLGVKNQIHLPGIVSDQEKYWLYKNCQAFVFPSLTEGFGLPVVEAMSLGKPVFLAKRSSLPEVGGEQAFYWENFEGNYMQEIFVQGLQMFNSERALKSIVWASQFSWKNAAKAYLKLYSEI